MNLRQLEVFSTVAEVGSFSKAAMVLNTAQPALSRQIRSLEVELKTVLLVRTGRGVMPTESGKRLLQHCRRIMESVDSACHDLSERAQEHSGHIMIGLPPSIAKRLTLPLVQHFQSNLPHASLEVMEGFSTYMTEWLVTGRVDLCLLYNPHTHQNIASAPIRKERLFLVGPSHGMPTTEVPFKSLAHYPLLMPQSNQIFRKLLEAQALLSGISLNVAWAVSSIPVILEMLRAGYGYAVLTESAFLEVIADGHLVARAIVQPKIHCTLSLVQRSNQLETPLVAHTREVLHRLLQAQTLEIEAKIQAHALEHHSHGVAADMSG